MKSQIVWNVSRGLCLAFPIDKQLIWLISLQVPLFLSVVWHLTFVKIWKTLFLKVYAKNFTGWGTIPRVDCPCRQVCNSETTDRHLRGNGDKIMFDFSSEMDSFGNPVSVKNDFALCSRDVHDCDLECKCTYDVNVNLVVIWRLCVLRNNCFWIATS